jgi:hypothetical protein
MTTKNHIKTSFRHDEYVEVLLEKANKITNLSKSELVRNAVLGQYVPMVQRGSFPLEMNEVFALKD